MNYINQPLSAKLEKLGLKSKSGFLLDNIGNIYTNIMPRVRISDCTKHDGTTVGDFYLAYTLSDILNPDNLKKLFGEEKDSILYGDKIVAEWEWEGRMILDHYWQGWDQLEKYLEGVL